MRTSEADIIIKRHRDEKHTGCWPLTSYQAIHDEVTEISCLSCNWLFLPPVSRHVANIYAAAGVKLANEIRD